MRAPAADLGSDRRYSRYVPINLFHLTTVISDGFVNLEAAMTAENGWGAVRGVDEQLFLDVGTRRCAATYRSSSARVKPDLGDNRKLTPFNFDASVYADFFHGISLRLFPNQA